MMRCVLEESPSSWKLLAVNRAPSHLKNAAHTPMHQNTLADRSVREAPTKRSCAHVCVVCVYSLYLCLCLFVGFPVIWIYFRRFFSSDRRPLRDVALLLIQAATFFSLF